MENYRQVVRRRIFLSKMTSPLFLVIYLVCLYSLYCLSEFKKAGSLLSFIFCLISSIIWIIYSIVQSLKIPNIVPQVIIDGYNFDNNALKLFFNNQFVYQLDITYIKAWKLSKKYFYITLCNGEMLVVNVQNIRTQDLEEILNSRCKPNLLSKDIWTYISASVIAIITLCFIILISVKGVSFKVSYPSFEKGYDYGYSRYKDYDDYEDYGYGDYDDYDDYGYDDYDDYDYGYYDNDYSNDYDNGYYYDDYNSDKSSNI